MAAFFAADKTGFLGLDWHGEGRTEAARGALGNLDRALTSLTLHADLKHLLSNVFYGCLFSVLFSQVGGGGVAWFLIFLSGFLGNLLSVMFSPPNVASLGASTMVFGALGALAAYQWRVHKRANLGLRQWAPLVAGTVLLGFYGLRHRHAHQLHGAPDGLLLRSAPGGDPRLLETAALPRTSCSAAS